VVAPVGRGGRCWNLGPTKETEMSKFESVFHSRRVWTAIGALLFAISDEFGLSIPPETIQQIVLLAGVWILGDSIRRTE